MKHPRGDAAAAARAALGVATSLPPTSANGVPAGRLALSFATGALGAFVPLLNDTVRNGVVAALGDGDSTQALRRALGGNREWLHAVLALVIFVGVASSPAFAGDLSAVVMSTAVLYAWLATLARCEGKHVLLVVATLAAGTLVGMVAQNPHGLRRAFGRVDAEALRTVERLLYLAALVMTVVFAAQARAAGGAAAPAAAGEGGAQQFGSALSTLTTMPTSTASDLHFGYG
jgi:hypothetical protein